MVELTPGEDSAGKALERRVARLLWKSGYFVRRDVQMILEKGISITDLDVYAVQFDDFLRPTRVASECKGQEAGFDAMLRLRGIADYYTVDLPLIVRHSIAESLLEFIHSLGMLGVTTSHLSDLEDYRGMKTEPFRGSLSLEADTIAEAYVKHLATFPNSNELVWRHRIAWMVREPHQRFSSRQVLHADIEAMWAKEQKGKLLDSLEWLMIENFILAAESAVEIASELIDRPKNLRKQRITTALLGGDTAYAEKKKIVDIVKEIITASGLDIKPEAFQLEPAYAARLNDLVGEFLRNPQMCQKFLRFLDFAAYEFVVPRRQIESKSLKDALGATDADLETYPKWSQMLGRTLSATGSIPKPLGNLM